MQWDVAIGRRRRRGHGGVQMTAWGSFALDVPRRNLRSFCFVSSLKVYNRASEDWGNALVYYLGIGRGCVLPCL